MENNKKRVALIGTIRHCKLIMSYIDVMDADTELIPIEPSSHGMSELYGNRFDGYILLESCNDDRYRRSLSDFMTVFKTRLIC